MNYGGIQMQGDATTSWWDDWNADFSIALYTSKYDLSIKFFKESMRVKKQLEGAKLEAIENDGIYPRDFGAIH